MRRIAHIAVLIFLIVAVTGGMLVGIGIIVLWGAAGVVSSSEPLPSLPFESSAWRAASAHDESEKSVRLLMAQNFLDTQDPVGRTRTQIVELLGEPDDTEYFSSYDMVYHLGPQRGPFGVDCEWLVIRLRDGVVTEAAIASD